MGPAPRRSRIPVRPAVSSQEVSWAAGGMVVEDVGQQDRVPALGGRAAEAGPVEVPGDEGQLGVALVHSTAGRSSTVASRPGTALVRAAAWSRPRRRRPAAGPGP
jgi:hypothetical protein